MNNAWHKLGRIDVRAFAVVSVIAAASLVLARTSPLFAEEQVGHGPLRSVHPDHIQDHLPAGTELLFEASSIERFLQKVEGRPPDWALIYGHGHHDPDHDERLFRLNRERDDARAGHEWLRRRIAFLWSGELSAYDSEAGGFRVALGPIVTPTSWGMVRFKYEDLPGNLIVVPTVAQRPALQRRIEQGGVVEIDVIMAGFLIPDESIVYDFSHDAEGLGLIMPVVRVDQVLYLQHPQ